MPLLLPATDYVHAVGSLEHGSFTLMNGTGIPYGWMCLVDVSNIVCKVVHSQNQKFYTAGLTTVPRFVSSDQVADLEREGNQACAWNGLAT